MSSSLQNLVWYFSPGPRSFTKLDGSCDSKVKLNWQLKLTDIQCVTGFCRSLKFYYLDVLGAKNHQIAKEAESLLLNVAGKLLMFPRDNSGPRIKESNQPKHKSVSYM